MQGCAEQICGDRQVEWPSFYHKYTRKKNATVLDYTWDLCTTVGLEEYKAPLVDWTLPYFWNKEHCFTQVYLDAWTNDGSALIRRGTRVIKERSVDTIPYENKVSNSSIGQIPKFSVYTTASVWGGVTPYFTVNSCTGGRAGGFVGYKSWVDGLSERSKAHIRAFMYYNHEEAKKKLPESWATDPFSTSLFRVCFYHFCDYITCLHASHISVHSRTPAAIDQCLQTCHFSASKSPAARHRPPGMPFSLRHDQVHLLACARDHLPPQRSTPHLGSVLTDPQTSLAHLRTIQRQRASQFCPKI